MPPPMQLAPTSGSRVLVAGGCGGIGRELVSALIDAGIGVTIFDLPTSAERHPPPAGVSVMTLDASLAAEVDSAFATLDASWPEGFDGFVNLVGFAADRIPLDQLPIAEWQRVVDGNLGASYLLNRAAVPRLKKRGGGAVVNVASGLATRVMPGFGPYSASKAAVVNLTRALAMDMGEYGVRVNAVAPGVIDTPMQTGGSIGIAGRGALKRMGDADEVANAVAAAAGSMPALLAPSERRITPARAPVGS